MSRRTWSLFSRKGVDESSADDAGAGAPTHANPVAPTPVGPGVATTSTDAATTTVRVSDTSTESDASAVVHVNLESDTATYDVRRGLRVAAAYSWRLIVVAAAVYLVFIGIARVQLVAIALFVSLVFSALLAPLVNLLNRWIPRWLAVLLSIVVAIVVVGGAFTWIGTQVAGQSSSLANQFSGGVDKIEQWLRTGPFHVNSTDLQNAVNEAKAWLNAHKGQAVGEALGRAGVALEVVTGLALAIFCSVFFLHSGEKMYAWGLGQTPRDVRRRWDKAARAGWKTFAGYTRGIVLVAASNGILVAIALSILRVPLALPLALLVFFMTFIPLIGAPIALAFATVVALAARGPLIALIVLILIVVIGQIEGHVLQPLIMSRAVSLHPIVVAISVAAGAVLAGVVGAVVAVPIVAVCWSVFMSLRDDARQEVAASPPVL